MQVTTNPVGREKKRWQPCSLLNGSDRTATRWVSQWTVAPVQGSTFFFLVIWPMCFGKLRLDFIFQVCYIQVVILTISIGNRLMNLGPTPCQLDNCIAHYVQWVSHMTQHQSSASRLPSSENDNGGKTTANKFIENKMTSSSLALTWTW